MPGYYTRYLAPFAMTWLAVTQGGNARQWDPGNRYQWPFCIVAVKSGPVWLGTGAALSVGMTTLAQTSEVSLSILPAFYFAGRVAFFTKGRDTDHVHLVACWGWSPAHNAPGSTANGASMKCPEPAMIPAIVAESCAPSLLPPQPSITGP